MNTTLSETLEVSVGCNGATREMKLSVAAHKTVRDVLRVSAARFHVLSGAGGIEGLQLRRVGELQALDPDTPAGDVLAEGDRLIVEPIASTGGTTQQQEEDLTSVAGRIVGDSLSRDSRTFLREARHPVGE